MSSLNQSDSQRDVCDLISPEGMDKKPGHLSILGGVSTLVDATRTASRSEADRVIARIMNSIE